VRVASLPDRLFTGTINRIGTVVGEGRVVPVQAQLDNAAKLLKPGMFAELEVVTDRTSKPVIAIPATAIVEANGKKIVYVQSGDIFQSVEVNLGQITGDLAEVKTGLFAGDRVVTQRGMVLYAQSLRGGGKAQPVANVVNSKAVAPTMPVWGWLAGIGGSLALIGTGIWAMRRRQGNSSELDPIADRFDEQQGSSIITGIIEEPAPLPESTIPIVNKLSPAIDERAVVNGAKDRE
jgi:membrane fusion protein, heavy metal efflux system